MGTLFEQPVRDRCNISSKNVSFFLKDAIQLSQKHNIDLKDVIEAYKVLEMSRQNDLYVSNGNVHDEQMTGIGEELYGISTALGRIATVLENQEE